MAEKLSLAEIKSFLPHRDPFLFADEVVQLSHPSKSAKELSFDCPKEFIGGVVHGRYFTKEDHPIFSGHFPGNPILPGVVQIEMMAQHAAFLCLFAYDGPVGDLGMEAALASIEKSKFKKPIFPGMLLDVHCELMRVRGHFMSYHCYIEVDGKRCAEGDIMATLRVFRRSQD